MSLILLVIVLPLVFVFHLDVVYYNKYNGVCHKLVGSYFFCIVEGTKSVLVLLESEFRYKCKIGEGAKMWWSWSKRGFTEFALFVNEQKCYSVA